MRIAFERITEPLFGWIPDISVVPRSRQVALGVAASIIIHALIFGGAIVGMFVLPERVERPPVAPEPKLELVIQPKPEPKPLELEPLKPERRFLTKEGLQASEKPKNVKFESDRDMVDGTEVPAAGTSELPGQQGETAPMMRDFVNQDISLDRTKLALRQEKMEPLPPSPPQTAAVAPMYAPLPLDDKARAQAEKAKPEEKLPEPAKATRATPPPLKVKTPTEDQIAIAQTPKKEAVKREYAMMSTPVPLNRKSPAAAYQEQLRKTRNESVISNRGIPGVAAVNTPAGRWTMGMKRAFSQNWQLFIHQNADLVTPGTVRVTFTIGKTGGRPQVVKVEPDGKASTLTVQACQRAVAETPLAPPPADLFEGEPGERLEDEITFVLY